MMLPPLVAPAITLTSFPSETTYPFIAGFGPIYDASILFASNDSIAEGHALNWNVSTFTLFPKAFWKSPFPKPITAWT